MAWLAEMLGRRGGGDSSAGCDCGPGAATCDCEPEAHAPDGHPAGCGLTCPSCGLTFETLALRCPRCAAPISFGCSGNCGECGSAGH